MLDLELPADRRYTKLTVIFTGKTRPPVYVLKNGKVVATYPVRMPSRSRSASLESAGTEPNCASW